MDAADLDVLQTCAAWQMQGHGTILVTVMRTWGSSPRPPGAMMALRGDGRVAGSVSGGCIKDDLIDKVRREGIAGVAPGGTPRVLTYGVAAEEARRFGLPCGGTLQLVAEPIARQSRIPELVGRLASRQLTRRTLDLRNGMITLERADRHEEPMFDDMRVQYVLGPSMRLLVVGAGQLPAICARRQSAWDSR